MTEAQLQQEINQLRVEISNLETELSKYQAMGNKINEALPKLTMAKNGMDEAFIQLNRNYSDNGKPKDDGRFQAIVNDIEARRKQLQDQILVECNRKIQTINSSLITKRNRLSSATSELNSMVNARQAAERAAASSSVYYPRVSTATSLIEGLRYMGVDSSFASRQRIAIANGITNYTGTVAQDNQLLTMLKNGTLKK